jgi:hypothetical protein
MMLSLFIIFLVLAFVLVWLGYFIDIRAISVVGFVFLFILSFTINPSISSLYGGKGLELESNRTAVTSGDTTVTTYNYITYSDSTTIFFGYLLGIIGAVCFWLVLANRGGVVE